MEKWLASKVGCDLIRVVHDFKKIYQLDDKTALMYLKMFGYI